MQRPLLWLPSRARTKAFLILLQKAQCSLPAPGSFVWGSGNQNEGRKNQLEFEEAALEVCNLPWRAQWRWQCVLPISLSCVTGILWAPLAAKAAQSLKNQKWCKCDQLGDVSGSCTSPHPSGSLPTGKSPPNHSPGNPWCPPVTLPWRRRNHLLSQGWNWAGAVGHSLPHPGKNAAPTSTPWPESSLSPRKAEGIGVAAYPKFRWENLTLDLEQGFN